MDEDGLVGLMYEGDHILELKAMDRQREEEDAEAALHEAQDRAFALVKEAFHLTNGEWNALNPEFRAPDEDWHSVVILHAFGRSLWVEIVGIDFWNPSDGLDAAPTLEQFMVMVKERAVRLFLFRNGRRPRGTYISIFTPDRLGVAEWLVKAQQEQRRQALVEEAQARVFTPFAFYRVWYGHDGDEYYDVRNPHGMGGYGAYETVFDKTVYKFVYIPQPVLIERITIETPRDLPGWCPTERVEIMGEEVLLFKTPEWAMPIDARKTVEELLH